MTTGKVVYLYKTDKQTQIKLINIPNIINQTYKYTKDTGKIQSKQTNIWIKSLNEQTNSETKKCLRIKCLFYEYSCLV